MVEEAAAAFLSNDAETDAASLPPSAHFNVPTGGQVEAGRREREGMNFAQGRISCHGKSRLKFREIEFDETPSMHTAPEGESGYIRDASRNSSGT